MLQWIYIIFVSFQVREQISTVVARNAGGGGFGGGAGGGAGGGFGGKKKDFNFLMKLKTTLINKQEDSEAVLEVVVVLVINSILSFDASNKFFLGGGFGGGYGGGSGGGSSYGGGGYGKGGY